jgi:hypothetical protein
MRPRPVPAALFALALPVLSPAASIAAQVTLPKGTTLVVRTETPFSSRTAKKGDTFRAATVGGLWVDGRLAVPAGSPVSGEIKVVKSAAEGAKSAALAVKFEDLTVGGHRHDIEGVLTSLKHDDRTKILELYPKATTGRKVEVILIGSGTEPDLKASTLVGLTGEDRSDLAEEWAPSGLGPSVVDVAAGTLLTIQMDSPVTVDAAATGPRGAGDRSISVAPATVKAAQEALKARGLYAGPASGELDQPTRNAIARFQIDRKLSATGDLDEQALVALQLTPPR